MYKAAILYIVDKKWGYYNDLVNELGKEMVDDLCYVGFIRIGYTRERKTWRALDLAHSYIKDLGLEII